MVHGVIVSIIKEGGMNIFEDLLENLSRKDLFEIVDPFEKEDQIMIFKILRLFAVKPKHLKKLRDVKIKLGI